MNTAASGAVTTTSLATTLASYVTVTTLASYVTLTSLATTLGNYVTKIANDSHVTTSTLTTALSPYAPLASPALTGAPTITPTDGTVSAVATQAWVAEQRYSTILSFWVKNISADYSSYSTNYSNINNPLITWWYRLEMLFPPDPGGPHEINWNVPNQSTITMFTSINSNQSFVIYFYIYGGTNITTLVTYTNNNPGENGFYYFTLLANVPVI